MLSKQKKLNLSHSEARNFFFFKQKKKGTIKVFYRHNDIKSSSKIAVVIPKKIIQKATQRNKIKRFIFRSIENHPILAEPIDLVIKLEKSNNNPEEIDLNIIKQDLFEVLIQVENDILQEH